MDWLQQNLLCCNFVEVELDWIKRVVDFLQVLRYPPLSSSVCIQLYLGATEYIYCSW